MEMGTDVLNGKTKITECKPSFYNDLTFEMITLTHNEHYLSPN